MQVSEVLTVNIEMWLIITRFGLVALMLLIVCKTVSQLTCFGDFVLTWYGVNVNVRFVLRRPVQLTGHKNPKTSMQHAAAVQHITLNYTVPTSYS